MSEVSPPEERTVYVANFADEVDDELLEELFTQTGPVVKVILRDVKDSNARFALVEFEDEASVLFAIELMNGVKLFNKEIQVKPRNNTRQEELYRRKRGEIEQRVRSASASDDRDRRGNYDRRGGGDDRRDYQRDRSPHRNQNRDYDRNSRNGGGRDSWQPRHRQQNDTYLDPPPPPPPLMGGGGSSGGSWRGPQQPSMLPHQLFVNMMHQRGNVLPPPPPPPFNNPRHQQNHQTYQQHQNYQQNPPRRQDYRGADRNSANHHHYDRRRGGGGDRRY